MASYKSPIERFLDGAQKTGDIMLRYQFQKEMMKQDILDRRVSEALVEDVATRVLSRLSATVDVTEIVEQIEELRKELDKLYDYFK